MSSSVIKASWHSAKWTPTEKQWAKDNDRRTMATLKQLCKTGANRVCADCSVKHPGWAVLPHGVHVCIDCAQVHRRIGRHISIVKAINTGTYLWHENELDCMVNMGNERSTKLYLGGGGGGGNKAPAKPKVTDEQFIRDKYEARRWYAHGIKSLKALDGEAATSAAVGKKAAKIPYMPARAGAAGAAGAAAEEDNGAKARISSITAAQRAKQRQQQQQPPQPQSDGQRASFRPLAGGKFLTAAQGTAAKAKPLARKPSKLGKGKRSGGIGAVRLDVAGPLEAKTQAVEQDLLHFGPVTTTTTATASPLAAATNGAPKLETVPQTTNTETKMVAATGETKALAPPMQPQGHARKAAAIMAMYAREVPQAPPVASSLIVAPMSCGAQSQATAAVGISGYSQQPQSRHVPIPSAGAVDDFFGAWNL